MSEGADDGPTRTRRDLDRLITFVDAIVAIAITLLVLPLVDLAGEIGPGQSAARVLGDHADEFWSFILSFVVIARFWLAQHEVLRPAQRLDRRLIVALFLWTLSIVFLPFPTALLSRAGLQGVTKLLYIGTLLVNTLSVGLLAHAVRAQLPAAAEEPRVAPAVWNSLACLAALVLALAVPALRYWPLLLLLLADPVDAYWRRRSRRR